MEDLSLMRVVRGLGITPHYAGMDPALRRQVIATPYLAALRRDHASYLRLLLDANRRAVRRVYFELPGPDPVRYLTAAYYALAEREGIAALWGQRLQ